MTKQEILDKYIPCQCWPAKDGGKVYNVSCPQHAQDPETAMDEWAEIEAISFAEWKDENYVNRGRGWRKKDDTGDEIGPAYDNRQLFQLYKTQQTKTS